MKSTIASWICIDNKQTGTYFPSAKGRSSDVKIQNIYWRCLCTFFWSARYHNPGASLVLFSNQENFPTVEGVEVQQVLKKLNVTFYKVPFEYVTPDGYYSTWRNQFFEFSIFKFISNHPDFNKDDLFLLLDSDSLITGNLQPLFLELEHQKCITYRVDYPLNFKINGVSRTEMKEIFEQLLGLKSETFPDYFGGEFYAATIEATRKFMGDFYFLWQDLLQRNSNGKIKFNEEAHVLSFLFYINGFIGGDANKFVKRLWTDPTTFRNITYKDKDLLIWHLPAEKTKGFRAFFRWLHYRDFNTDPVALTGKVFHAILEKTFSVPYISLRKQIYFSIKRIAKKTMPFLNAPRVT